MTALVSLLCIYGYAILFNIFAKKSVSVSIFLAISSIIVLIFTFGLIDFLKYGTYIVFYGGFISLIIMFLFYKKEIFVFATSVPVVIYTVMSIVYLYLMKDAQLFFWDEYSHWGAFIKEMYYFHHFYDANSVAAHLRYPPGISVWDYFILLTYGFYSEGSLYFAYFLILFSSVLMMYEKLQWRQYYWIVTIFASQMILFATYGHWFSCIYVDHIIGAMFAGMLLAYLVDTYTDKELLYFIFPAIAIVLVKEIGLFFVLSFVGLVLLLSFYNAKHKNSALGAIKEIKKIVLAMLIVFISSFLVLKLWDSNRDSFLIPKENQSISGIVKSIISDEKVLDAKTQEEVKKRFWEVVQNQQLHKEKVSLNYNEFSYDIMNQYQKEYKLSTFGTLLFFLIIVTFAYFVAYEKDRKKSSLIIGGYLVCVAMGYLLLL